MSLLANRTIIVTGAASGIGRAHALELARLGAHVVVNDVTDPSEVVSEIERLGGSASGSVHDISDWDQAEKLVAAVVRQRGSVHGLINNAGIVRDKLLVNMSPETWDDVIRVHLRGTFCTTRHVAAHWRERAKEGDPVDSPRIVNTSSPSGLFGNIGQANYGAAKAAIASLTVIAAEELARFGVMVNAIAPTAMTGMTDSLDYYKERVAEESANVGFDTGAPDNIAPLAAWLCSSECDGITGRVLSISGGTISVVETWVKGPTDTRAHRWTVEELRTAVPALVSQARPNSAMDGHTRKGAQ